MQGFHGSSHYWANNHADVYCVITIHHQNMKVSVYLNISFFCFGELLLTWTLKFLWKQPSMSLWSCWCFWNISAIHFVCRRVIAQSRSHSIRSDITQNKHLPTRQMLFDVKIKFHKFKFCINFNWNSNWNLNLYFNKKEKWNSNPYFKIWKMKKYNFHFSKN